MATKIEITLPRSWSELSQEQLRFLLRTIVRLQHLENGSPFRDAADFSEQSRAQVATVCFLRWGGFKIVTPYAQGWLLSRSGTELYISNEELADAITCLDWIGSLPSSPVRLDEIKGHKAAVADLSEGFPYEGWLYCEDLWQGWQVTADTTLLRRMAAVLYSCPEIEPEEYELLSVFYWWAAVKDQFSQLFPNFFRQAAGNDSGFGGASVGYDALRRAKDAQIRALTKGDITKEREVLSMETWRALTELDALARDYDDLQKKYGSK